MNNRKPRNKRGVLTRIEFIQEIPEPKLIMRKNMDILNPRYPGTRRVVHRQVSKVNTDNLWGRK